MVYNFVPYFAVNILQLDPLVLSVVAQMMKVNVSYPDEYHTDN